MVLFLVVLDHPSMTEPAQRVALHVEKETVIFSNKLLMYVGFRRFSGFPDARFVRPVEVRRTCDHADRNCDWGIIWAASLIASGMVSNAGIDPVVALYAKNPAQVALTWLGAVGIVSVCPGLTALTGVFG